MTDTPQAQGRVPHHAADGTLKHYCSEGYCPDITDRQERRKDAEARTSFVAVTQGAPQPLSDDVTKCRVCGEPMPPGEEMFVYHGYSGPCPKPPLPKEPRTIGDIRESHERSAPGANRWNYDDVAVLFATIDKLQAQLAAVLSECDAIEQMAGMGSGCEPELHNVLRWIRKAADLCHSSTEKRHAQAVTDAEERCEHCAGVEWQRKADEQELAEWQRKYEQEHRALLERLNFTGANELAKTAELAALREVIARIAALCREHKWSVIVDESGRCEDAILVVDVERAGAKVK